MNKEQTIELLRSFNYFVNDEIKYLELDNLYVVKNRYEIEDYMLEAIQRIFKIKKMRVVQGQISMTLKRLDEE